MGKLLRWTTAFIVVLIFTAILEPPLMAQFSKWGWHEKIDAIPGDVLNWISNIVGENVFPWLAGGIIGFSAGLWTHHWTSRLDRGRDIILAKEQDENEKLVATARDETLRYCETREQEQNIEEFFYTQPWFHNIKESLDPKIVRMLTNTTHLIGSPAGAHTIDPKAHEFLKAIDDLKARWRQEGKIK